MPTAKRVHESARTKEPLPVLRFSFVPPLFTESASYSICTHTVGGEPSSPEMSTFDVCETVLHHAQGG